MRKYLSSSGITELILKDEINMWENIESEKQMYAEILNPKLTPLSFILEHNNQHESEMLIKSIISSANDLILESADPTSLIRDDQKYTRIEPRSCVVCVWDEISLKSGQMLRYNEILKNSRLTEGMNGCETYLIKFPYIKTSAEHVHSIVAQVQNIVKHKLELDEFKHDGKICRMINGWKFLYCTDGNDNILDINQYFSPSLHALDIEGLAEDNIQSILSTNYWNYEFKFREDTEESEVRFDDLAEMLNLLDERRFSKTGFSMDIGRIIFNHLRSRYDEVEQGLDLWKKYTPRSMHERMDNIWRTFHAEESKVLYSVPTILTLYYYAREDNPVEYGRIVESKCSRLLDLVIETCTDGSVAKYLHAKYGLDFICSSTKSNEWYVFNKRKHRWEFDEDGNIFKSKLDLMYKDIEGESRSRFSNIQNNVKSIRDYSSDIRNITRILKSLDTQPFRNRVIKYSSDLFFCRKFNILVNRNPDLFVCQNCVLQIIGNSIKIRPGKPEDYMTKGTEIPYIPLNVKSTGYKFIMNFLRQIFNSDELIEYIISLFSSSIKNSSMHRMVANILGIGKNGKSQFMSLVKHVFGDYHTIIQKETVMSMKKSPDSPSPGLSDTKDAKIVQYNEISETDKPDESIIKQITGADYIRTRNMYEKGGIFVPAFLLIVLSNIPQMMNGDKAMRDRMVMIPCDTTFSKCPPQDTQEQIKSRHYLQDPDIENKISKYAPYFLSILVSRYSDSNKVPSEIDKFTSSYWRNTDPYDKYTSKHLILSPDNEISYKQLYEHFSDWYEDNFRKKTMFITCINRIKQFFRHGTNNDGVKFDDDKDIVYGLAFSRVERRITNLI